MSQSVTDNVCGAISVSFIFCGEESSFYTTLDMLFQTAASQGQSVFIATGDWGAAGLRYAGGTCVVGTTRNPSEMATSPHVTAVGGTTFNPQFNSSGNDTSVVGVAPGGIESGWNASGGGESAIFAKPMWQTGPGVPADGFRDIPDVAMIAWAPYVFIGADDDGTAIIQCCWGGTSLASPLWAGYSRVLAQASSNARLGLLNPTIYNIANAGLAADGGIEDVLSGNNTYNGVTGYAAGPGYRSDHRMGHGGHGAIRERIHERAASDAYGDDLGDADAERHADCKCYIDRECYIDKNFNSDRDHIRDGDNHPNSNRRSHGDSNSNCHCYRDWHSDYDRDCHCNGNCHRNHDCDRNSNAHLDANRHGNGDSKRNRYCNFNHNCHNYADHDHDLDTNSHGNSNSNRNRHCNANSYGDAGSDLAQIRARQDQVWQGRHGRDQRRSDGHALKSEQEEGDADNARGMEFNGRFLGLRESDDLRDIRDLKPRTEMYDRPDVHAYRDGRALGHAHDSGQREQQPAGG